MFYRERAYKPINVLISFPPSHGWPAHPVIYYRAPWQYSLPRRLFFLAATGDSPQRLEPFPNYPNTKRWMDGSGFFRMCKHSNLLCKKVSISGSILPRWWAETLSLIACLQSHSFQFKIASSALSWIQLNGQHGRARPKYLIHASGQRCVQKRLGEQRSKLSTIENQVRICTSVTERSSWSLRQYWFCSYAKRL